ncbi:MAG TPA: xanthine dehydrogenase family protein subunit M [Syntrophorhabdales bacterium]|nr:xanthine dehydrogenase family protein subunit M [Syntrophorhabdales bacterium]
MIHDFTYLQPGSVKEALGMLAEHKDDCKIICGGQSLLIVMRQGLVQTDYLIDIKRLNELNYIKYDGKGGLKIGATTTHRTIEKSDVIAKQYPVLADMEEKLASIQVRNWGTIGGNLAHADAAGDPAPVLTALNATVKVASAKGERTIPLEEFYTDLFETAMEPGEIVLEVQVPPPVPKSATAYKKFNLLESDQGIVAVAASITLDAGDTCKDARIVLGNAAPTSIRAKKAESVLIGKKLTDALFEKAGEAAAQECEPVGDIHASEEYRRHLVGVLTKRMAKAAFEQAKKMG